MTETTPNIPASAPAANRGQRPTGRGGRGGRPGGGRGREDRPKPEYDQKTLDVRRVTRVVRGGRRFSFSIVMAIGNRRGKVGLGVGKGGDVSAAIDKAVRDAKKGLMELPLSKTNSIPHEVSAKFASSKIVLRPAPGRGLIAGSSARALLELAGVKDVSAKFTSKSKNKLNNARVTITALRQFIRK